MALPTSVWNKAKEKAKELDAKADSFRAKLVKSNWTWLILGGEAGLFLVAVLA